MPIPVVQASINAAAPASGGITVANGDTVDLSLTNPGDFSTFKWEIYSHPAGFSCPSGWSTDADGYTYYREGTSTPETITIPAATWWGKLLLRVTCDGDAVKRDELTAVQVLGPLSLEDVAPFELAQFDDRTWVAPLQRDLRILGDGLSGAAPAILAATEADLTAADSGSVANGTRAYVASHRSVWRKQTSDGTGLTAHERIVGYTDGHVYQRELVRSAYYELQPEWWVDPDAGSDEATGATSGAPIKTLKELFRRVAPDGVWHVSRAITVHVGNNYVGSTLPDITFHTGTGAVTVSIVGWEANPTVHTQYTVDTTLAPVPSTNQRDTATMTAAVSDWTVGDIVRDESNNGGDAYFTIGYIDGGVPERVELCQGVESVIGDVVIDPEAADTFRRVELAPLTIGGIRVIGGVPISIALCNVDSAGAPTSAIEGVKFIACKLANVWLGPGSSASGCSIGTNCRAMGSRDSADAEYASLYRCCINNLFRVTTHVDLYECYIRSAVYLQRYASAAVGGPCQVHLSAVHGAVFSLTDYGHALDLSTQYSLYGGAPHVVAVASQVVGGLIRMLSDGTSVAFASTESDMQYTGAGEDWQVFYPRPDGAVAANYPAPADIIDFANWVAAPFNGQLARNRYCDLMIAPVEPAS